MNVTLSKAIFACGIAIAAPLDQAHSAKYEVIPFDAVSQHAIGNRDAQSVRSFLIDNEKGRILVCTFHYVLAKTGLPGGVKPTELRYECVKQPQLTGSLKYPANITTNVFGGSSTQAKVPFQTLWQLEPDKGDLQVCVSSFVTNVGLKDACIVIDHKAVP